MSELASNPRRSRPVTIEWHGMVGRLLVDGECWGAVEWSAKRQTWCIEDAEGRCLSHHAHVHGAAEDKAGAVALAEAMIHDGRMPTPEDAKKARKERLKRDRERKAAQPAEIRRREARAELDRLWHTHFAADRARDSAGPLYEAVLDTLDLTDPELWRSNSFARLRDRLILEVEAKIAALACECARPYPPRNEALRRAREVLDLLLRNSP